MKKEPKFEKEIYEFEVDENFYSEEPLIQVEIGKENYSVSKRKKWVLETTGFYGVSKSK